MNENGKELNRRGFLKKFAGLPALGLALPALAQAAPSAQTSLQVWSCGGLAEAMLPAHELFTRETGVQIAYTGAFAAALGKTLLGSGVTEVFAGRVLGLAKDLRKADKMVYFKPLCFTSYVMVTPKGNPAGISVITDMAKPGVKVALAPEASPPGGAASLNILKRAGIFEAVMKNCGHQGTCVQRSMDEVISGRADVSIAELRVSKIPDFIGKLEVVPIPDEFFPPPPLTFTIGVMKQAKDRALADKYVEFMLSERGQAFFAEKGFIPATSDKGKVLVEKLGVKDA